MFAGTLAFFYIDFALFLYTLGFLTYSLTVFFFATLLSTTGFLETLLYTFSTFYAGLWATSIFYLIVYFWLIPDYLSPN